MGLAASPRGELGSWWLNHCRPCQPQPVPGARVHTKAPVSSCQQLAPLNHACFPCSGALALGPQPILLCSLSIFHCCIRMGPSSHSRASPQRDPPAAQPEQWGRCHIHLEGSENPST